MVYREHPPCAALAPYVECYWTLSRPRGRVAENRVLPDGCMDVIVAVDAAGDCAPTVVGTMTTALVIRADDVPERVGVRFRPGCGPAFLRVEAPALVDRTVPVAAVWGASAAASLRRVAEVPLPRRAAMLEGMLLARLAAARTDARVDWIVRRIADTRGRIAMDELGAAVGWGPRHLRRRVEAAVGVGPKRLGRIVRLRALLTEAACSPSPRWAELAVDAGYCDQAHLVRECRALAGEAPSEWLLRRTMSVSSKTAAGDPS